MIKDRGNKKWVSLMLVEHRRALRKLKKVDEKKEKAEISKDMLTEFDYCLQTALEHDIRVKVKFYHQGSFVEIVGRIKNVVRHRKELIVKSETEGQKYWLQVAEICSLELA